MISKNIIIIGAPRSGTNMLRDILCAVDNVGTWPCDEINYVWKYGNKHTEHDELTKDNIKPNIEKYINNSFDWVRNKYDVEYVVEKTCANTLRVDFVDKVLEGRAKYIFIYRDPYDVTASAIKRWTSDFDFIYSLKKVRFVPFFDLLYYVPKHLFNRVKQKISKEKRLSYWGPKHKSFKEDYISQDVLSIAAKQWQVCVNTALDKLKKINKDGRLFCISYESFVKNPDYQLKEILKFMGVEKHHNISVQDKVSTNSVGKGHKELSDKQKQAVNAIVGNLYKDIEKELYHKYE